MGRFVAVGAPVKFRGGIGDNFEVPFLRRVSHSLEPQSLLFRRMDDELS
jgi:hypothetical protein